MDSGDAGSCGSLGLRRTGGAGVPVEEGPGGPGPLRCQQVGSALLTSLLVTLAARTPLETA